MICSSSKIPIPLRLISTIFTLLGIRDPTVTTWSLSTKPLDTFWWAASHSRPASCQCIRHLDPYAVSRTSVSWHHHKDALYPQPQRGPPHTEKAAFAKTGPGFIGSYILLRISVNHTSQLQSNLWERILALNFYSIVGLIPPKSNYLKAKLFLHIL